MICVNNPRTKKVVFAPAAGVGHQHLAGFACRGKDFCCQPCDIKERVEPAKIADSFVHDHEIPGTLYLEVVVHNVGDSEIDRIYAHGAGTGDGGWRDVKGKYTVRYPDKMASEGAGAATDLQRARVMPTAQYADLALILDPLKLGSFKLPRITTFP